MFPSSADATLRLILHRAHLLQRMPRAQERKTHTLPPRLPWRSTSETSPAPCERMAVTSFLASKMCVHPGSHPSALCY